MTTQTVRTFIAALVGTLITRLVALLPVVQDVFGWADGVFAEAGYAGLSTLALVQAAIVAAVIVFYQKLAQSLGDRWPEVEKIMLGSAARPTYVPRYGATD